MIPEELKPSTFDVIGRRRRKKLSEDEALQKATALGIA